MTEISPEKSHYELLGELVKLASVSPKIGESDRYELTSPLPYRDNFFKRFKELHNIKLGIASDAEVIYMRMIKERFGLDMLRFYDENQALCESAYAAIEAKAPYDILLLGKKVIVSLEDQLRIEPGSANAIDIATSHNLGIGAVGLFYWNSINPLLQEAYETLEPTTLNAPFLTK